MRQDRYALTYRAVEAQQVMGWIKAGQSGCLISLRGAGKSNFLRFLLREEVRQHYLGGDFADFTFVLIDLLALSKQAEWVVYELILNRLLGQLRSLGTEKEIIDELTSLHREVRHTRDPLTAQWAVEQGIDLLCRRLAQRIVLFFDQFDTVFETLNPSLFRCLRAIRDAHKGQVSYVVVVTDDLACLRDDLNEVEHFYRLVSRNVCGLGPYNETDARQMIRYLASQRPVKPNEEDTAGLTELSGGHPGLLKTILNLLCNIPQEGSLAEIAPTLTEDPAVQAECWKVWAGLSEREQTALHTLIAGGQPDPHTFRRLKLKGLIREERSEPLILSPLFTDFVRRQAPPSTKDVIINRSARQVQIEGRRVETLTELEFEIVCYLYEYRGQVCTKDKLIQHVYSQQYDRMTGGVSDAALQTLVARLRAKIEPDCGRPRYVITVRGEGHKFADEKTTTNWE